LWGFNNHRSKNKAKEKGVRIKTRKKKNIKWLSPSLGADKYTRGKGERY